MLIYIYILFHQVVIMCNQALFCQEVSLIHLKELVLTGVVELIFERALVVRVYKEKQPEKKEEVTEEKKETGA